MMYLVIGHSSKGSIEEGEQDESAGAIREDERRGRLLTSVLLRKLGDQ
jgi:hypothetical protein